MIFDIYLFWRLCMSEREIINKEQAKASAESLRTFAEAKFSYKKCKDEQCNDFDLVAMDNAELFCVDNSISESNFLYAIKKENNSEYVLIFKKLNNINIPGELSSKNVCFSYDEQNKALSFRFDNKEWVIK